MYIYKSFETKADAIEFKSKNGKGVLYDLDKERKRKQCGKIPDSLAAIYDVPLKYKWSVEWNGV